MWTFGKKIALGFALSFLLMLVIGGMSYRTIESLTRTSRAVAQTHDQLFHLGDYVRMVSDLESQQRGILVTGDPDYLAQIKATAAALPLPLERLRRTIGADAQLQQQLADLVKQADAKTAYVLKTIEIYRSEGREAAQKYAASAGDGKDVMDELVRRAEALDKQIRQTLDQRAEEVESAAGIARSTILYGTVLGLLLITTAGVLLTRSLTTQIAATVQHVQRSSSELQTAATQQSAGAREASTAMTEIATTITELLAASRQIAESAQRVASVAEQTADAARLGDGTVRQARESITGIRQQVDLVVDHMLDLGRKSQQIGAVLEIVSELAEQTNILAINATIEATGAGEMGKRFGVVADEIRKLADRVAGATKEIRGLIDDVRSAVNTTVMATETGSKAVDQGARQFGEVASSFGRIAELVGSTTDAAREIGLSTKQQTSAVEQVNVAIANTVLATRETEASSGQTFQTARQLAHMSRELLRMVQAEPRGRAPLPSSALDDVPA